MSDVIVSDGAVIITGNTFTSVTRDEFEMREAFEKQFLYVERITSDGLIHYSPPIANDFFDGWAACWNHLKGNS